MIIKHITMKQKNVTKTNKQYPRKHDIVRDTTVNTKKKRKQV